MTKSYSFLTEQQLSEQQRISFIEQVDQFNVWPTYVLADAINTNYWDDIYKLFADCQFYLVEDNVVIGNGNCIPLHLTECELNNLSEAGWDWALEKSVLDHQKGLVPNTLCALQIGISKAYQGKGISKQLIDFMKGIAIDKQMNAFILPIRPNQKANFPLIAMEDYIQWKNHEGLPFDAWIRTHVKGGANIVKICSHSMYVEGTVAEWQSWSNQVFQSSGQYILPVLLNPITIDLENDKGVYVEPNVWLRYNL